MSDWIGLGIIILIVVAALVGLSVLGKPYSATAEEYEKRAQEGPGAISAGMIGLQKILDPGTDRAAAVQQDLRQGFYDGEQESGDKPEPGSEKTSPADSDTEEERNA